MSVDGVYVSKVLKLKILIFDIVGVKDIIR